MNRPARRLWDRGLGVCAPRTQVAEQNQPPAHPSPMQPTPEQAAVVAAPSRSADGSGRRIVVAAYAGSGKTKVLEMRARTHVEPTLALCFGAKNAEDAKARMPKHVRCVTGHGLAWSHYGRAFEHKFRPSLAWFEVASHPDFPGLFGKPAAAAHVLGVLQRFLWSADLAPGAAHLPPRAPDRKSGIQPPPPLADADAIACTAELWNRMIDPHDPSVPATHDALLKMLQLAEPVLPYRTIFLDEAQDSNPVVLALLARQRHATLVVVGDRAQAVFGWRGAVDALSEIEADEELRLSHSFRFGPAIAGVANGVLASLGERVPLRGVAGKRGAVGVLPRDARALVLARSTSGVVSAAIAAAAAGKPIGFIGGLASYPFDGALGAWRLWRGQAALGSFESWTEYRDAMEAARDRQGLILVRMVDEYGDSLPALVARVRALAVEDHAAAAVIISTAHRAKGCEFEAVRMMDDFPDPLDDEDRLKKGITQELNLLYVCATRAATYLEPCAQLTGLLGWMREARHAA